MSDKLEVGRRAAARAAWCFVPLLAALLPDTWQLSLSAFTVWNLAMFAMSGWLTWRTINSRPQARAPEAYGTLVAFVLACGCCVVSGLAPWWQPDALARQWLEVAGRLVPGTILLACICSHLTRRDKERSVRMRLTCALCVAAAWILVWHYLITPWQSLGDQAPEGLGAFVCAHGLLAAGLVAFVIPYSLRVMSLDDFSFLQGVILWQISNLYVVQAEAGWLARPPGWASVTGAMAAASIAMAIRFAYAGGEPMLCNARLAPWRSMRCAWGAAACTVHIAVMSAMVFAGAPALTSTAHVVRLSWCLFASWSVSNWLALWLSHDLRALQRLLPLPLSLAGAQDLHRLQMGTADRAPFFSEIQSLVTGYNDTVARANELLQGLLLRHRDAVTGNMASQVAHDIRSPLSALHMALPQLRCTSEEHRVLFRTAVFRIQDIATQLLEQHRGLRKTDAEVPVDHIEAVLISSLVETVVSEKRTQFRARLKLDIEHTMSTCSYGLFARVCPPQFKRVLANLIDNAVEAAPSGGTIALQVAHVDDKVCITVRDEGCGMPPEILAHLGDEGVTHGKVDGTGSGVHQTMRLVRAWGGNLMFQSAPDAGTTAVIELPRAPAPGWFLERIVLDDIEQVVILDDDLSIHRIWDERFVGVDDVIFKHQSTPEELRLWRRGHHDLSRILFLLDFELLGFEQTGLDLVEELNLQNRAILVTSRFEETHIIERCEALGVRLLPKPVAAYVPVIRRSASPSAAVVDAVLIDDDPLVHLAWSLAAKRAGKTLALFRAPTDFLGRRAYLHTDVPLYVDAQLGDMIHGEDFAKELQDSGFTNVILATGRDPEAFGHLPWINRVVGKEPPF